MARRQRKSDFDRTVQALSRLPWQISVALAPVAWFGFHLLAQIHPPIAEDMAQMGNTVGVSMLKTAGLFLQFLAPLTLLLAALLSWLAKRRRTKLLEEDIHSTVAAAFMARVRATGRRPL